MVAAPENTPAPLGTTSPQALLQRAIALMKAYPGCFWYWNPSAGVQNLEDVRLVIDHLRKYGDRPAWLDAQELLRCLSPTSNEKIPTILAANRTEKSHFAGGVVLSAFTASPRFSRDFDIFHELAREVTQASDRDLVALRSAGSNVETVSRYGEWEKESSFRSAKITNAPETVEIDWASDSALRFFPIERDAAQGWRLHYFDAAVNKALALAARTETRDHLDILEFGKMFPLTAICWAGCGKDPGFTPLSLLGMMRRFARLDPVELRKIEAHTLDPKVLKVQWIEMSDEAEVKINALADRRPDLPVGVAFVDAHGKPGWVGDNPGLRPHPPSIRGCWPEVRSH
jgi:hypothetical protein